MNDLNEPCPACQQPIDCAAFCFCPHCSYDLVDGKPAKQPKTLKPKEAKPKSKKSKDNKRPMNSKILSYRCKGKGIVEGLATFEQQLSLGHNYHKALVENEHKRRAAIEEARDNLYPDLPRFRQLMNDCTTQIEALRTEQKAENSLQRKKGQNAEITTQIEALKEQRKAIAKLEKPLRLTANKDAKVLEAWEKVEARFNISSNGNALRSQHTEKGLHFGTYQQIERQVKRTGPLPNFPRWTGEGKARIYLGQKGEKDEDGKRFGVKPLAVLAGQSRECKLSTLQRTNAKGITWQVWQCALKIANTWVTVDFDYDRPLPEDCEIREVCIVRRKVATHYRYQLQFTVAKKGTYAKPWKQADNGMVAIDVGYRRTLDGLRIAAWKGSDGEQGEIVIPNHMIARNAKVPQLQATRADAYNNLLATLRSWLTENNLPEWLQERTKTIAHWKSNSQARLASLVLFWRSNRFTGDEAIFSQLDSNAKAWHLQENKPWRNQDKHLYTWQEFQRKRVHNWREVFYRRQLQTLAERYQVAVIEAELPTHKKQYAEEKASEVVNVYRALAANGRFHQLSIETFAKVVKVNPAYTTIRCNVCKKLTPFDKGNVENTCSSCGAEWDQDYNAAENILRQGLFLDPDKLRKRKDHAWEDAAQSERVSPEKVIVCNEDAIQEEIDAYGEYCQNNLSQAVTS